MKRISKASWLSYGVGLAASVAIAVAYALGQDLGSLFQADRYRVLSDSFAVPGMLGIFIALLLTLSGQGALDGVGYCLSRAVHMLSFRGTERETYKDYLERHQAKRPRGFGFLYCTGLTCLAVAGIFLALFHNVR